MITALFIFDSKGDVLMSKLYRAGLKRNIADVFRIQVITGSSKTADGAKEIRSPVLTLGSTSFIYTRSSLLWICAVTRSNQDCSAIQEFLFNFESLLKVMFLGELDPIKPLTDEIIVNNFSTIYELLDVIIDFGYPTNMELSYIKNFMSIPSSDNIFKLPNSVLKTTSSASKVFTNKKTNEPIQEVTWRSPGIKYRKNEIILNVDEKVNLLMNAHAEILRVSVDGSIQMKTHLSGMPECQFGFNDDTVLLSSLNQNRSIAPTRGGAILEDCKFHQSVQLDKFDSKGIIQFIPPDGEFQLMSYHSVQNTNLPFKVYPQIHEIGTHKVVFKVRICSTFSTKLNASNVQVRIPTPKGVIKSYSSSSGGKSKFHPEENIFNWKFSKFFGDSEQTLTAEVELSNNSKDNTNAKSVINWTRPPITLNFTIDMFSCSGLTVKFLTVNEKSNYRTVKWVKYTSHSGSYDIRY